VTIARVVAIAFFLLAGACTPSDRVYDASVATLAARVEADPRNRALQKAVEGRLAADPAAAAREIQKAFAANRLLPLRVPGLYYESHPQSGADLSSVERWLGGSVPLVPANEVGTVEENAHVVATAIRTLAGSAHGRVVLFSASKGSADVRYALEKEPDLAELVAIWIDLAGVLEGTPLTEEGSAARLASAKWLPAKTADSMSDTVRRSAPLRVFPPDVRAVHFAAFPSVASVSDDARDTFRLLRARGPTDGYVLLESYLRAPGRVLVLRDTDHYLRTKDLPPRVAAAILVLVDEIALARPAKGR
jgi:hypothetical protein